MRPLMTNNKPPRIWAVLPAAGSGQRMGGDTPKQYLPLAGQPVLWHTLRRLCRHPRIVGVQPVLAADDARWPVLSAGLADLAGRVLPPVTGGDNRAASVLQGLQALARHGDGQDWVMVHDAARPCLRLGDLDALIAALDGSDGAILGAPVADTLKRVADDVIIATMDRSALWRAFTPQVFRLDPLRAALQAALDQGMEITDESSAMEWAGYHPRMVRGHGDNIKITLAEDLPLAAQILASLEETCA